MGEGMLFGMMLSKFADRRNRADEEMPYVGFWSALALAPVPVAIVGIIIEQVMIRRLYGREPLYGLLLTSGPAFVLEDLTRATARPAKADAPTLLNARNGKTPAYKRQTSIPKSVPTARKPDCS